MRTPFPLQNKSNILEGFAFLIYLSLFLCLSLPVFAANSPKKLLKKAAIKPQAKLHPYIHNLVSTNMKPKDAKSSNYNRLLVILVEFAQEVEDDPLTTGDGRFLLEADPSYLYSIGAPPHNHEYFQDNLKAVGYYYLAASAGQYQLEYDIYPQDGSFITLPKPMGYYNPPNASGEQFTALMEEYFYQSFSMADAKCPEIDFASYDHYMIIHAGSDWQHDIAGDTPSDIPSFYIHVDDSKAVPVNNGSHHISHACNVPSTISQDFSTITQGDYTIHSGYGAINSVLVHEFGHSLGLVDLYNVYNFQPMVGMFDIMDSGGGGVMVDQLEDGSLVYVEGVLPVLPGAFSRALLFEDQFRDLGLMKDLNLAELNESLNLAASSFKQNAALEPTIYKLTLSDSEYILLENRSVDPDDDGATAIFTSLEGRVVLHPTPIADENNFPSYEYDYLLPSFQRPNGDSEGGGILAWLINEDLLYNQGVQHSDGVWLSNFENNTVNVSKSKRGVRVIEADGLEDIGNEMSWFWTGTPYEYFHKAKPSLDANGSFLAWSAQSWRPSWGPNTKPALTDSKGIPSLYRINNISHPSRVMSFELQTGFFDEGFNVNIGSDAVIGPMMNTSFGSNLVPVITKDNIRLFDMNSDPWQDWTGSFTWQISELLFEPIISKQNIHQYDELVLCQTDRIKIVEFWNDALDCMDIDIGSAAVLKPLAYEDRLYIATRNNVCLIQGNQISYLADINDAKALAIIEDNLLVLQESKLSILDGSNLELIVQHSLPAVFGNYEPIVFNDISSGSQIIFVTSNKGDIYSSVQGVITKIFQNNEPKLPTQLGIFATSSFSPILFWGIENKAYAMLADGTMLDGFPYLTSVSSFSPQKHVYAILLDSQLTMQLPVEGDAYMAINLQRQLLPELSLGLSGNSKESALFYHPDLQRLYWKYQHDGVLSYHYLNSDDNPISWAGERNGSDGQFNGTQWYAQSSGTVLSCFVYPNPVVQSPIRIRAEKLVNQAVNIKIYDVAAKLVLEKQFDSSPAEIRDFSINHKLSNGIYFAILANGNRKARIKFAVINGN